MRSPARRASPATRSTHASGARAKPCATRSRSTRESRRMNGFDPSSSPDAGAERAERLEAMFPDDFSPDEIAFARELHASFPVDREELPPLYVRTLMEDEWRAPVRTGYESLLVHRVF